MDTALTDTVAETAPVVPDLNGQAAPADAAANTAPAPALDFSSLLDKEGQFTRGDWAGENTKLAGKFKSLASLVKSYETLERMNSNGNKVALPSEHATEEEWNAFYEKLGRPAEAAGYEFTLPDEVKSALGAEGDKEGEALAGFREVAHAQGLNAKQAAAVAEYFASGIATGLKAQEEAAVAQTEALKQELAKEWGPVDGPRWKRAVAQADYGMTLVGLTQEALAQMPESRSPHFIKAMAKVAAMSKEAPSAGVSDGGQVSDEGFREQIRAIRENPKHPYNIENHPDHDRAIAQMKSLYGQMYAGG